MDASLLDFVKSVQIVDKIYKTQGLFFEKLCKLNPRKIVGDLLSPDKSLYQAELVNKYLGIENKKLLEIGSGLGVNLIVWTKRYNIDGYGIEPDAVGFESSHKISKELIALNGIDPDRILDGTGESIPFEADSFDIVYSTNVLEHVTDPAKVLEEALRVLRVGGVMQFVYPNYHSYFDGHYAIFHPPILWKSFFPWYVKFFFRRNPQFARTLRTELNVFWTKKQIERLQCKYKFEVLSLGQEIFLERMRSLNFQTWAGLTKVKAALNTTHKLGLNNLTAKMLLLLNGWSPIILTVQKDKE